MVVLFWCWLAAKTGTSLIIINILYGIASGAFVSLQAPMITRLADDMRFAGTMVGQVLSQFLPSLSSCVPSTCKRPESSNRLSKGNRVRLTHCRSVPIIRPAYRPTHRWRAIRRRIARRATTQFPPLDHIGQYDVDARYGCDCAGALEAR